jgi:hypothetical protein
MKRNTALLNRAWRWLGTYMMKPDSLFRHLTGNLPGVLLWLAVLPLAAHGQANYATPYTFITLAGKAGVAGSADGTGSAARFNGPAGVAADTNGNVYVGDVNNNTIRKVTPAGVVTTLAGRAGYAGSVDGTNNAARFYGPGVVAMDNVGNIYVSDNLNYTIRKLTPVGTNWVVTTLAGKAGFPGSADGTNSAARFYNPGVGSVDSAGNVYVADISNHTIRKLTPVGTNWVVTTLAGLPGVAGSADGTNSAARFHSPWGATLDSAGNLYVGDQDNGTIRKVTPIGTNWVVTTLAGLPGVRGYADGTNSTARFWDACGVTVDSAGNLYVGEYGNCTIRKVTPVGTNWVVTTLAGVGGTDASGNPLHPGSADGTGAAALFNRPSSVAMDSADELYVADFSNNTIRKGFPATSVPPPILQAPSLSAGQFGFGITGLPGLAVNIESSTNLFSWQVASTKVLVGGTNYYSASPNPAQGAQFYRAHGR